MKEGFFTEWETKWAPRGIVFPFVVPVLVDKSLSFDEVSFVIEFSLKIAALIISVLTFFWIPYFKPLFFGIRRFQVVVSTLILSTLFVSTILPSLTNSVFLNSFRYVFWCIGVMVVMFVFSHYCNARILEQLGWKQVNDSTET